jgi:phage host-nuclease inhibitor protein Gam
VKLRIKAPSLKTRLDFEHAVDELARTTVELRKAQARRDTRLQDIRDEYEPACRALSEQIDGLSLAAEKYAEEHRDELMPGKVKSAETPLALYGFRLGQPTLKTLSKAWTWDRVLEELAARDLTRYIRTTRAPDKDAMKQHLTPEQLAGVGCRIDQTETFFVEAKDQSAEEGRS